MRITKICVFICVLLSSSLSLLAQEQNDSTQTFRGVQYDKAPKATYKEQPLFCGVSVGVDLAGIAMAQFAKFGQYEAQARFNFKQRYFGVFEAGIGTSNYTNEHTDQHYNVHAPYFRVGADYNLANNPLTGNRIFVGGRYAFSAFNYSIDGPAIQDYVYGDVVPYSLQGLHGRNHWLEIVAGLEGRLWRFIHLGWTIRGKLRLAQKENIHGQPYYVPGFGDNSDSFCFGGTFSLSFDISDIKNSRKKK